MPAAVSLYATIASDPKTRERVIAGVRRAMEGVVRSPMASRTWKLERTAGGPGQGPLSFRLKGFEEKDADTMSVTRSMDGLSQDDLKAIVSEINELLHGDEHG